MKYYTKITEGTEKWESYPSKDIQIAISGVYLDKNYIKNKSKKELIHMLRGIYEREKYPIIHEDSLSAWVNNATEKYGLTVGDIRSMNFGDKMDVILMDRNLGDYINEKDGYKYDVTQKGCTYAEYIHGEGLTGMLNIQESYNVLVPFTWDINLKAINNKSEWFFGPIDDKQNVNKINPKILVGWRGPSVDMKIAKKYLSNKITHYGTWWDDGGVYRYTNYLLKK